MQVSCRASGAATLLYEYTLHELIATVQLLCKGNFVALCVGGMYQVTENLSECIPFNSSRPSHSFLLALTVRGAEQLVEADATYTSITCMLYRIT